jgi:hypothetical protein
MDAFTKACVNVSKPLIDIPEQWKPFIPSWYGTSSSTSTLPSATTSASTNPATAANRPNTSLNTSTAAGIAVGSLAAMAIILILGCWGWRNHKKVKRKDRENATLADAMHPDGVAAAIDNMYSSPQHTSVGSLDLMNWRMPPPLASLSERHDVYGNHFPQMSEERYDPMAPIASLNPTASESAHNSTSARSNNNNNPKPADITEEDYFPAPLIIRKPRSKETTGSVGTTASPPNPAPDHYEAYESISLDRNISIGSHPSCRPRPKESQGSMGSRVFTASPVQRRSFEPYEPRAEYDDFGQKVIHR